MSHTNENDRNNGRRLQTDLRIETIERDTLYIGEKRRFKSKRTANIYYYYQYNNNMTAFLSHDQKKRARLIILFYAILYITVYLGPDQSKQTTRQ